jgi:hypothetical protein
LIHDIIRRQHEDVTARTLAKSGVAKLRQASIRSREQAIEVMRSGTAAEAETIWRAYLEKTRDLVMVAYKEPVTIDVLNEPLGKPRPLAKVRRAPRLAP